MIRKAIRSGLPLLALASLSMAAAPDRFDGPIEGARRVGELRLDGELFHVQGLALEAERIWVTSVDEANRKA